VKQPAKPKHRQLYDELQKAIRGGSFSPGQRLPTELELMQQYKVSRTTVTRTLRDLESQGVVWRRRGSGSYVSQPKEKAHEPLGVLVHGMEAGSIFVGVYEGLVRAADRLGRAVQLVHLNGADAAAETLDSAKRMIERGVRGVFYLPYGITGEGRNINQQVTDLMVTSSVPLVLLDRDIVEFPQRSAFDLVGVDNFLGGYLLGQHFVEIGCRRTLFFCENVRFSSARARWMGYRAAMEANKLEPQAADEDPFSASVVLAAVKRFKPDGIICDNDRHAAMLMRHLIQAGFSIPKQIKLAGFDDTPTASLLTVPLTTVRQPAAAIGARAMSVMHDRITQPWLPPAQVSVECDLIARESTQPDNTHAHIRA
jgi:DNA-binding LacI/PurR family transcriptional regulator